jgi:hypothetical protein
MINSFYSALGGAENERIGSVRTAEETQSPATDPATTDTRSIR